METGNEKEELAIFKKKICINADFQWLVTLSKRTKVALLYHNN